MRGACIHKINETIQAVIARRQFSTFGAFQYIQILAKRTLSIYLQQQQRTQLLAQYDGDTSQRNELLSNQLSRRYNVHVNARRRYRKRLLKHSSSARVDTDVTARDLVLEIKFTSCKRHRSAESRVRKCTRYACALCGHLILLFGKTLSVNPIFCFIFASFFLGSDRDMYLRWVSAAFSGTIQPALQKYENIICR